MTSRRVALVLTLLSGGSLFLAGCASGSSGLTKLAIVREGHSATVSVEIAETPAAIEKGVMGRSGLPTDQGMLFVIEQRGIGFWMKDVSFPLSVAFISRCGVIVDVQDMEAYSLDFHDTPHDFRFGLEVNKGWFQSHGVSSGDTVQLPQRLRSDGCP